MKFCLRIAFLLLLVTGTVTGKGSDLSGALDGSDPNHKTAVNRPKRISGFSVFDILRGNGGSATAPKYAKPAADPKPSRPAAGNDFGFDLEDALLPAVTPIDDPIEGDCHDNVAQKLDTIIDNQNQELRLLRQLVGRSLSKPMR